MKKTLGIMLTVISIISVATLTLQTSADWPAASDIRWGGSLVIASTDEPKSLNPLVQWDDQSNRIGTFGIFDKLLYTELLWENIQIPGLAKSWEASTDAKVYTFHLFTNVTWHDGHNFTSADVKWTLEKIIADKLAPYDYVAGIDTVQVIDDYTVRITLKEPDSSFLSNLGIFYGPIILPKHLYEGTDFATNPYNSQPVGTGPFKFKEWVRGSHVIIEANDGYYLGRSYIDRIIIKTMSIQTAITAYEAGEVDYVLQTIDYAPIEQWSLRPDLYTVGIWYPAIIEWIGFNLMRSPYTNLKVREAIAYAVDRDDICERVFYGYAKPSPGVYFTSSWAYNPDTQQPVYNTAKAEELLDEAGFLRDPGTGVRFTTTLSVFQPMSGPDIALVIKEQLRLVGIEVVIESMDWPTYSAKVVENKDFDFAIAGGYCGPDPNAFTPFITTDGFRNMMSYSNATVDQLMVQGAESADIESRKPYYFAVQEIILADMPRISLLEYPYNNAASAKFSGYWFKVPELELGAGKGGQFVMTKVYWREGSESSPMEALKAIEGAEVLIQDLAQEGYDTANAITRLDRAKEKYDIGNYDEALVLAEEAPLLIFGGGEEVIPIWVYAIVVILAVVIAGLSVYIFVRKK